MKFGRPVKRLLQKKKKKILGNALVVQWLGLGAFTAAGPDSFPGWRTTLSQTS